jgi:WD40 repeat protein
LGVILLGIVGIAYLQRRESQLQEINALNKSSEGFLLSHKQLEALVEAMKSGKQLKQVFLPQKDIQFKTAATLQQAVYKTQEINRLESHTQQVNDISFSPDGKFIISASDDRYVKLWSADGMLLNNLRQSKETISSLTFSLDGKLIAFPIINIKNQQKINNIEIHTIDTRTNNSHLLHTLTGDTDEIFNTLSFSPDSKSIVSTSRNGTIKLWNIDDPNYKWKAHGNGYSATFNSNGSIIAFGGDDNTIKLLYKDGTLFKQLYGHTNIVTNFKFSSDGKTLTSASKDKTIRVWNINDGKLLNTRKLDGLTTSISTISFSPDSNLLVSTSNNNIIQIWGLNNNNEYYENIYNLEGHTNLVNNSSFIPNHQSKIIASTSQDKTIRIWRIPNIGKFENNVHVVDTDGIFALSPNAQLLASLRSSGKVKIIQIDKSGNQLASEIFQLDTENDNIQDIAFSLNSKFLAIAGDNKNIKLWDVHKNQVSQTLEGHTSTVRNISFSQDILASGSVDGQIKLWRIFDGKYTNFQTLEAEGEVTSLSFKNDGKLLASGTRGVSNDKLKVWHYDSNIGKFDSLRSCKTFENNLDIVKVLFSPSGKTLAYAVSDGNPDEKIKLWNVTEKCVGGTISSFQGNPEGVASLSFSPDSQILVSGGLNNTIQLWDANNKQLLKTLSIFEGAVKRISFSPNKILFTSNKYGIETWNLNFDNLMELGCERLKNYLNNNSNINQSEHDIREHCKSILSSKRNKQNL